MFAPRALPAVRRGAHCASAGWSGLNFFRKMREITKFAIAHPGKIGYNYSAFSIQHSAFSIQHSAFSIQHSAFSIKLSE
jgi:hypothetical protein